MCLSTVDLNLKWSAKEKSFIGEGFQNKRYYPGAIGVWLRAVPRNSYNDIEKTRILSNNSLRYHPGFHIFLDAKHALAYSKSSIEYGYNNLYKVKYRTVLSYGTNYTELGNRPCVIALEMKVERELTQSEYKKLGVKR